jgi:hypothetical protein
MLRVQRRADFRWRGRYRAISGPELEFGARRIRGEANFDIERRLLALERLIRATTSLEAIELIRLDTHEHRTHAVFTGTKGLRYTPAGFSLARSP